MLKVRGQEGRPYSSVPKDLCFHSFVFTGSRGGSNKQIASADPPRPMTFLFFPAYRLSGSSLQTCPFGVTEELNGGCTTVPKKCPTPYSAQGKTNCRHWCHNENIGICEWAMLNSSTYSTVNHPFQSENPRSKIPTTYVLSL